MQNLYYGFYNSPIGNIQIIANDEYLLEVYFTDHPKEECANTIIHNTKAQLAEYFQKKRQEFDLPLQFNGTSFQNQCHQALMTIEYGQTVTYQEQAQIIGRPKACRAVGTANGKNKISIIVPCHRVVSKNGLGGYGGGLNRKEYLLNLEKTK